MSAVERLGRAGISVPGFNITARSPTKQQATPAGTTFAEKKAALNTAHSFYKSPTSVSVSDARAASKTGRNFQERHGDQVMAGYQKAEELGLNEKLQSRGGNDTQDVLNKFKTIKQTPLATVPFALQRNEEKSPRQSQPHKDQAKKKFDGLKRPPPLPPKKKPLVSSLDMTAGPPPIPIHSRPSLASNSPDLMLMLPNNGIPPKIIPEVPSDLDLGLDTGWFFESPLKPPKPIADNYWVGHSTCSHAPLGKTTTYTLIVAVRYALNLSTTKIKITWDTSAPTETVVARQRHSPPPRSPPPNCPEWGDRILAWARARIGQQVGNGICYTLAYECFLALHEEDKSAGRATKIMIPQGPSWGLCIFTHYVSHSAAPISLPNTNVKPGDILQFWAARWIKMDADGRVFYDLQAGAPEDSDEPHDHTAIVETIRTDSSGAITVGVLEANSGGNPCVSRGSYVLGAGEMNAGGVRVFRAVSDTWATFNAVW
jgi:hypothetical protein